MNNQATKETKQKNGGFTMMKNIRKQLKNEKGLTLVELLAVIVILAIIAAIAVPAIGNIIKNSKYNAAKADALNVLNAAQMYYLDNPDEDESITLSNLTGADDGDGGVYLESLGVFESADDDVTITSSPHKLSGTVTFDGKRTVNFDGATIDDINKDNQKGSGTDNKTIPE